MKSPAKPYPAELKVMRIEEYPLRFPDVDSAEAAVRVWRELVQKARWYDRDKECMVVLLTNTRRWLIGFHLVALGGNTSAGFYVSELFRLAVLHASPSLIMMHNHPSGDPTPSEADIKWTQAIIEAGEILKIQVLDHVIVGRGGCAASFPAGYASFRELGFFN